MASSILWHYLFTKRATLIQIIVVPVWVFCLDQFYRVCHPWVPLRIFLLIVFPSFCFRAWLPKVASRSVLLSDQSVIDSGVLLKQFKPVRIPLFASGSACDLGNIYIVLEVYKSALALFLMFSIPHIQPWTSR